jgi:hypothetical protein
LGNWHTTSGGAGILFYAGGLGLVAWKVIIKKMSEKDEKVVPLDKADKIADYLMKSQEK